MRRLLAVVALSGGVIATVYLATSADVTDLAPNRWATCSVRISEECQADYPTLKPYETLRFPVRRNVEADGGITFVVPRASDKVRGGARDCVEVVAWSDCTLDPANAYPNITTVWSAANPFTRVRSASSHVIPDCRSPDGGWDDNHAPVDCLRRTEDGGTRWAGCNIIRRSEASGTQCLDSPTGVVFAGERLEESL